MTLGIYGAGGLGREVLILAQNINKIEHRWDEYLFIDDAFIPSKVRSQTVSTFEEVINIYKSDVLEIVIAVGEPYIRNVIREKISKAGFSLATLIHPTVTIDYSTKLGLGIIICANCYVSCDVIIGDNVLIQPSACIGHDNIIGNNAVISSFVCIAGGCVIGEETYIGLNVPIKENIKIGSQTIIGMGSVVSRDIPNQVIALGNPARAMKENIDHKIFT